MFRRRVPLRFRHRLAGAVWPRPGWRRAIAYRAHRIGRLPDSPYRIAAGFASGVAVGLTPLTGLQFLLAVLLALAVRGNVVAALVGSFVNNPWTLPAIWQGSYLIGRWLLPGPAESEVGPLDVLDALGDLAKALVTLDVAPLSGDVWSILLAMLVGSLPIAAAGWLAGYWLCRRFIERYQTRRRSRRRAPPTRPSIEAPTEAAAKATPE